MERQDGLQSLDAGIVNYISNHMAIFKTYGANKVPTLAEANTYEACLGALKDYSNLVSGCYKVALKEVEGSNAEDT